MNCCESSELIYERLETETLNNIFHTEIKIKQSYIPEERSNLEKDLNIFKATLNRIQRLRNITIHENIVNRLNNLPNSQCDMSRDIPDVAYSLPTINNV
jgi:hypothetical protein